MKTALRDELLREYDIDKKLDENKPFGVKYDAVSKTTELIKRVLKATRKAGLSNATAKTAVKYSTGVLRLNPAIGASLVVGQALNEGIELYAQTSDDIDILDMGNSVTDKSCKPLKIFISSDIRKLLHDIGTVRVVVKNTSGAVVYSQDTQLPTSGDLYINAFTTGSALGVGKYFVTIEKITSGAIKSYEHLDIKKGLAFILTVIDTKAKIDTEIARIDGLSDSQFRVLNASHGNDIVKFVNNKLGKNIAGEVFAAIKESTKNKLPQDPERIYKLTQGISDKMGRILPLK